MVWERLCRLVIGQNPLALQNLLPKGDLWHPAGRWWQGAQPEWDVVSTSMSGSTTLVGEAKWSSTAFLQDQCGLYSCNATIHAPQLVIEHNVTLNVDDNPKKLEIFPPRSIAFLAPRGTHSIVVLGQSGEYSGRFCLDDLLQRLR